MIMVYGIKMVVLHLNIVMEVNIGMKIIATLDISMDGIIEDWRH